LGGNLISTSQTLFGATAGVYDLEVIDATGQSVTRTQDLSEPGSNVEVGIYIESEISNCSNNDGRIIASAVGGSPPYSYLWSHDPDNINSFSENLAPGVYSVIVTDANSCPVATDTIILNPFDCPPYSINFLPSTYSGYNITCPGMSDGFINTEIISGFPPYTYSWSTGETTPELVNLPAGEYILTVVDKINQSITDTIILTEPVPIGITLSVSSVITAYGKNDGVIEAEPFGGVSPYSYTWSNGDTTFSIDSCISGYYSVTVFDAVGCQFTDGINLTQPDSLKIVSATSSQYNGYNISCYNENNGSINITVEGGIPPYEYSWNNEMFQSEDVYGLAAGQYEVTVTDSGGNASASKTFTLTQPDQLTVELTPSIFIRDSIDFNIGCYHCFNGSITTMIAGGVTPMAYQWQSGETIADIDSLSEGIYSLVVTDTNGCTAQASILLTEPEREDWTMSGNSGTYPTNQFIGTSDSTDFVFRTNNIERLRILGNGTLRVSGTAGIGNRLLMTDPTGAWTPGVPFDPNDYHASCFLINTFPWYKASTLGPSGFHDIVNCYQRFGFGVITPQERVHINGTARFTSSAVQTDYLNIGHGNGNSHINSYGSGELLINEDSPQNVKISTGTGGDVTIGGNTYLATLRGKVGIGTNLPQANLQIDHDDVNGGIILNRLSAITTHSEIKFNQNGNQKWSIGNDLLHDNNNNFFIWNEPLFRTAFYIDENNNVGIDKTTLNAKLDINGNINATKTGANTIVCGSYDNSNSVVWSTNNLYGYGIGVDGTGLGHIYGNYSNPQSIMTFTQDGYVGIGLGFSQNQISSPRNPDYMLYVEGNIAAREIKVTANNFPDYVFTESHKLLSIQELESFITQNGHLPGIPSAQEVEKQNGFEIGKMQQLLLEKLEEQTLYIIDLKKQIDKMKTDIENYRR
jgi:hypothetical protein